jgi:protein TonB
MQSAHVSTLDHAAAQVAAPENLPSSNSGIASPNAVWLAPDEAESRLLNRVEPQYPADAIAAHRSGEVTLEVHVAEDGSVSSVQTLSGDPLLATAAAQAVRNWHYQPYRSHEQPSPFQTDVTLTFSLPN